MKKVILFILTACLFSCSKDAEQVTHNPAIDEAVSFFDGKFKGSLYSPTLNSTDYEELTFSPYHSTKQMLSLDGYVQVFGSAIDVKYVNDGLFKISKNCYYSISESYSNDAVVLVSFYEYDSSGQIINREDKRKVSVFAGNTFKMRSYGLSASNNLTYIKQ